MGNQLPRIYSDSLGTEIYDVLGTAIRDGGPTEGDIPFFERLAVESGGPVLEIGCGTGRVAGALAAAGFDVVGIDRSAPMLRLAEERRASLPPDVAARLTFVQGDMTTLHLGRQFPLIVAPSRVFQFALTSDDQRAALGAFRAHLPPDGRLVLDLFDPSLEYVVPGAIFPPRSGELVHPKTDNRVVWEIAGREPDPATQLVISDCAARDRTVRRGPARRDRAIDPALDDAQRYAFPLRAHRVRGRGGLRRFPGRTAGLWPRAGGSSSRPDGVRSRPRTYGGIDARRLCRARDDGRRDGRECGAGRVGGHGLELDARACRRGRDLGVSMADSPSAVAAASEIVITIVSDTPDVEAVLFGADGVADGAAAGSLVVDMSTISPSATREVLAAAAAAELAMLDAPVSGGSEGAKKGTLSIFVGGEAADLERARPSSRASGRRSPTSVRSAPDRRSKPLTRSSSPAPISASPRAWSSR